MNTIGLAKATAINKPLKSLPPPWITAGIAPKFAPDREGDKLNRAESA